MKLIEHQVAASIEFDDPVDREVVYGLAREIDDKLTLPSRAIANANGISVQWQFKAATYDEAFRSVARRILDCVDELGGQVQATIRDLRTGSAIRSRDDLYPGAIGG